MRLKIQGTKNVHLCVFLRIESKKMSAKFEEMIYHFIVPPFIRFGPSRIQRIDPEDCSDADPRHAKDLHSRQFRDNQN